MLLCISFRLEPDNALKLSPEEFTTLKSISIPEDNPDIEIFIEKELENCIESKKLVIGNLTLILEIRDTLLQGSQGMFLWVALQITSLCTMKIDDTICQALIDLSKKSFRNIRSYPGEIGSNRPAISKANPRARHCGPTSATS